MNRLFTTTQARANLYRLIDQVAQSHDPVLITGKQNNAVLVSEEDWESIQETIYLLSIPGVGISIKEGLQSTTDDCDEDLEW
jgi:prevent-host-death family protein